jgi:hypothetical protein
MQSFVGLRMTKPALLSGCRVLIWTPRFISIPFPGLTFALGLPGAITLSILLVGGCVVSLFSVSSVPGVVKSFGTLVLTGWQGVGSRSGSRSRKGSREREQERGAGSRSGSSVRSGSRSRSRSRDRGSRVEGEEERH